MRSLKAFIVCSIAAALFLAMAHAVHAGTPDARLLILNYSDTDSDAPLCRAIEKAVKRTAGIGIEVISKKTHAELEYALIKGEYDIAVLPPRLFLINFNKIEYSPAAMYCLGSAVYRAAVFASKRSGIEKLEDLPAETSVLFVDPFSASGFVVPYIGLRTLLKAEDLAKLKFEGFSGSHSASVKKLAAGEVDLIVSYSTLGTDLKEKGADIKNICEFKTDIPNDILVVSNDFSNKLSAKKRRALTGALSSLKHRGRAMTTKYSGRRIKEFADFSAALDSAGRSGKIRISVPKEALEVYVSKTGDEKLALAAIVKVAGYAMKSDSEISFEAKCVENMESAVWDVISGDSAYIFAGRGPRPEISKRFPRLTGDEFGFYGFR